MSGKVKRWYDREPTIKQSIALLETFPDEILTIIAEGANEIAEGEFKAEELMRSYKSLGQEKVLALYKSKNKARSYDKNPTMHKTVNYMLLISEDNRKILAKRIVEMVEVVRDYFKFCKEDSKPPEMSHVRSIKSDYVAYGAKAAREKLSDIRKNFMKGLKNEDSSVVEEAVPKNTDNVLTNLDESDGGMRLNLAKLNQHRVE